MDFEGVAAFRQMPEATFEAKRVIAVGEYVAVHSHVVHKPGDPGIAVVHIFRFEGDRTSELWDLGQQVLADNQNTDGMF